MAESGEVLTGGSGVSITWGDSLLLLAQVS